MLLIIHCLVAPLVQCHTTEDAHADFGVGLLWFMLTFDFPGHAFLTAYSKLTCFKVMYDFSGVWSGFSSFSIAFFFFFAKTWGFTKK